MKGGQPANAELKKKLSSDALTVEELEALMTDFVESAKAGNHFEKGWPNSTYGLSKVGVSALSRIQQRQFDKEGNDKVVNHVHPGYVDTDMTSHKGPLTIEEGAKSTLYAVMLPPNTDVKGHYIWEDCRSLDWVNGSA